MLAAAAAAAAAAAIVASTAAAADVGVMGDEDDAGCAGGGASGGICGRDVGGELDDEERMVAPLSCILGLTLCCCSHDAAVRLRQCSSEKRERSNDDFFLFSHSLRFSTWDTVG